MPRLWYRFFLGIILFCFVFFPTASRPFTLWSVPNKPNITFHWNNRHIQYYVNPDGSGLSIDVLLPAIQSSFDAWTQAGVGLSFEYLGTTKARANRFDGKNVIFWDTDGGFVGSDGFAATTHAYDPDTGELSDVDIGFSTVKRGSVLDTPGCPLGINLGGIPIVWNIGQQGITGPSFASRLLADVQATLTHEIGHLLGLDHSAVVDASMSTPIANPSFMCTTDQRTLRPDDIAGVRAIYPPIPGLINVAATLDDAPWPSSGRGSLDSFISGFTITNSSIGIDSLFVPTSISVDPGQYTIQYNNGGPPNSHLVSIVPSTTQSLQNAGSLSYILKFASNFPPVAAFTMESGAQTATEGHTLSVSIAAGTSVSVSFSADRSTAADGLVSAWEWSIDGTIVSSNKTFTKDLTIGSHSVQLVVTDNLGLRSTAATGIAIVRAVHDNFELFYDGSQDPQQRFFFASFLTPIIDSQNRLLVVSTHFGFSCAFNQCGLRANSISSTGEVNWQYPSDGSYITHSSSGLPKLGQNDVLFIPGFDTEIFAVDSNGNAVPGWPVGILPSGGNSGLSGTLLDNSAGILYAKAGVGFSFSTFPNKYVALNQADGSLIWEKDYENGGAQFNIVKGPDGNIKSVNGGTGTFVSLANGIEQCSASTFVTADHIIGGPEGVFATSGSNLLSFGTDCHSTIIFSAPVGFLDMRVRDNGIIFGVDPDVGFPGLFAASASGSLLWRDQQIIQPIIQTIKNGIVYVWAFDASDSNKQKLFLVNEISGKVLQAVETSSFCSDCGFAVANDGTVYMADHNSTKIYKLASPVSQAGEYLFIGNAGPTSIAAFKINSVDGSLSSVSGSPFPAVDLPTSLAATPDGKFLFAGSDGSTTPLSSYSVDPQQGTINFVSSAAVGERGFHLPLAVDPHSPNVFVVWQSFGPSFLLGTTYDPVSGLLPGNYYGGGSGGNAVVVDPLDRFVFTAGSVPFLSGQFVISRPFDSVSFTFLVSQQSQPADSTPFALAVDPSGRFLYVANHGLNVISAYSIDPVSGALSTVPNSPFFTGQNSQCVVTDSTGQFLYVSTDPHDIWSYAINQTNGSLTLLGDLPINGNLSSGCISIDPSGAFLYAIDIQAGTVSGFKIDQDTGMLMPLPNFPMRTGGTFAATITSARKP